MAKETDISSPIQKIAHYAILIGVLYLTAFFISAIPGAVAGSILGLNFGPLGMIIGTTAGIILNCLI